MRGGDKKSDCRRIYLAMIKNVLHSEVEQLNATACVAFFQGVAFFQPFLLNQMAHDLNVTSQNRQADVTFKWAYLLIGGSI